MIDTEKQASAASSSILHSGTSSTTRKRRDGFSLSKDFFEIEQEDEEDEQSQGDADAQSHAGAGEPHVHKDKPIKVRKKLNPWDVDFDELYDYVQREEAKDLAEARRQLRRWGARGTLAAAGATEASQTARDPQSHGHEPPSGTPRVEDVHDHQPGKPHGHDQEQGAAADPRLIDLINSAKLGEEPSREFEAAFEPLLRVVVDDYRANDHLAPSLLNYVAFVKEIDQLDSDDSARQSILKLNFYCLRRALFSQFYPRRPDVSLERPGEMTPLQATAKFFYQTVLQKTQYQAAASKAQQIADCPEAEDLARIISALKSDLEKYAEIMRGPKE